MAIACPGASSDVVG